MSLRSANSFQPITPTRLPSRMPSVGEDLGERPGAVAG